MSIGSRIKEQRQKSSITQGHLATMLGLSIDMVKKMESDKAKPSIETLEKLTHIFNCSADYFLGKDGSHIDHKEPKSVLELRKLLNERNNLVHRGTPLSEEDKKRLLDLVDIMFPPKDKGAQ